MVQGELVGQWHFDEGSGTQVFDSSLHGNNGVLAGGAVWNASGKSNSCVQFNGTSSYVGVGTPQSLAFTSAFSLSAWIFPTGPGSTSTYGGIIFNKENEYELSRYQNGTLGWAFNNASPGWVWINTGYVAPLNQWTHIAVVYDSSVVKTYANGTLIHSYSVSGNVSTSGGYELRIGGRPGSQFFQGSIDEFAVYNHALTTSEVVSGMTTAVPEVSSLLLVSLAVFCGIAWQRKGCVK